MSRSGTVERLALGGVVTLAPAAAGKRRGFDILLYTGAPVARWGSRVVFALGGAQIPPRQVPILFAHDPERPIGYTSEPPSTSGGVRLRGPMLENDDARFVAAQADQGFRWQASMGVRVEKVHEVAEGASETVNGARFDGPGYVVTRWALLEGSVLSLGADGGTSSTVLGHQADAAPVLRDFLGAFPPHRRGWAVEQLAELEAKGMSRALAAAKVKASSTSTTHQRLGATPPRREERPMFDNRRAGPRGRTFDQLREDGDLVDLQERFGERLGSMSREELKEALADEWAALANDDKVAYGDFDNFAAYRRAASMPSKVSDGEKRVRIRMGPPART